MIALLKGSLAAIDMETCILLCGGVGYELYCPSFTLADLQEKLHQEVSLFVHTHVREDSLQLFGFLTSAEKSFFLSLLKVNGIGPKSALQIISGSSIDQISSMIENEDVKALSRLPKIGKKTAEQLILSLKGKLVIDRDKEGKSSSHRLSKKQDNSVRTQVSSALVNLGFRFQDVERVLSGLDFSEELSVEEGVRQGLVALSHF